MIKTMLVSLSITLSFIIFFDMIMFFFLPNDRALKFEGYRDFPQEIPFEKRPPLVAGRPGYPRDYFVKHEKRGFDIGKNRTKNVYHWLKDGVTYPIWSNSIGCFDKEHAQYEQYVYFAGDSVTWGYTPFHEKFGTQIEKLTGTQILKCGVTHTGQQHQYEKFLEIVEQIVVLPKALFVFYVSNDIANDYAHPHSTVIHGWHVDNVSIDQNNKLVRHSELELKQNIYKKLEYFASKQKRSNNQKTWSQRVKYFFKTYSLSAQIIRSIIKKSPLTEAPITKNFYELPQESNGSYWLLDNPTAEPNKEAILRFKRFSSENNIPLVIVLIPPRQYLSDTKWYEEVRSFLTENSIRYIDLTFPFRENQFTQKDLYWKIDGHFNPSGNRVVAEILIKKFPDIF